MRFRGLLISGQLGQFQRLRCVSTDLGRSIRTSSKTFELQKQPMAPSLKALKQWSCLGADQKDLPAVSRIKAIHIYDFDNTLFLSPLPNAKLWTQHTIGLLSGMDTFTNGGWWQDNRLLEATGKGIDIEEPRAWEGWWNEDIVKLVELSMRQEDTLTVLLTGRGERKFTNIIKRMIKAKKLEFDLVCLKPSHAGHGRPYPSTMIYKQTLLRDLVANYQELSEMKIYEDRPKHTSQFRDFLNTLNLDLIRGEFPGPRRTQFAGEVIQVPQKSVSLDPTVECAEVQQMINSHNATNPHPRLQIKRTVFFTGYLLTQTDADNLITLLDPSILRAPDVKILANNIMITPKPATEAVLEKVNGLGSKQIWQVTAVGNWNGLVHGAKVSPIPSSAVVSVESPIPMVVLATLRGAKAVDSQRINNWLPVPAEKQFVFETTVGEKVQLRIEAEQEGETEYDSLFPKMHSSHAGGQKRKGPQDENDRPGRDNRKISNGYRGGRGGRDRDRGDRRHRDRESGPRNGGNSGRGGGGGHNRDNRGDRHHRKQQQRNNNYRSLDDLPNGGGAQHRNDSYAGGNDSYGQDHHSRQQYDAGGGGGGGGGGYDSNFPPLGGGHQQRTGGYDGNDDGGLHY